MRLLLLEDNLANYMRQKDGKFSLFFKECLHDNDVDDDDDDVALFIPFKHETMKISPSQEWKC